MGSVDLGFAIVSSSWTLRSKFFPHKVGGKPAWLTLNNLPEPSELLCGVCGNPCILLLQLYGSTDEKPDVYHRSIFIFMCKNGRCFEPFSNRNFVVFRSQLPRKNDFYSLRSSSDPDEDEKSSRFPSAEQFQPLCDVCGCKAVVSYAKSPEKNYCNSYHRKNRWDRHHKDTENQSKDKTMQSNLYLLPEYRIFKDIEDSPHGEPESRLDTELQNEENVMELDEEIQDGSLNGIDSVSREFYTFNKFLTRIQPESDQILRYQRGGKPLLVTSSHAPTKANIPLCSCGAKREFEFQVMPHLLSVLNFDSDEERMGPDWGTLLIYTCSESCAMGTGAYVKEFLWKQDI